MITSTSNPAVKQAIALREPKARRETGLFLIEGEREVRAAEAAGIDIVTSFVAPGAPRRSGPEIVEVAQNVYDRLAYRSDPAGVIAVARAFDLALDEPPAGPLTVLVADRIEKPGNLGAMIRTADAAGAWVVLSDAVTDAFNPNVVRASVGTLFTTPVRAATADEVRAWLALHRIEPVVTTPSANEDLWSVETGERTAVVVGPEDSGVDERWLSEARTVRIPMQGHADSLNAAATAAVVLFELARRRA